MSADASPLLYDFYGFPERLYRVAYPCGGCPEGAERVVSLLGNGAVPTKTTFGEEAVGQATTRAMITSLPLKVAAAIIEVYSSFSGTLAPK
jgi:hypothetical protein